MVAVCAVEVSAARDQASQEEPEDGFENGLQSDEAPETPGPILAWADGRLFALLSRTYPGGLAVMQPILEQRA